MFRIAICDDETVFSAQINAIIGQWTNGPADLITEIFTDGDSLIRAHSKTPFDIILLDVLMPLLDGIETAREIRAQDNAVKIVFLTSSAEYAVESYTVKANNYLLKPIDPFKLLRCLDELYGEMNRSSASVILRGAHTVHKVSLHDIEYLEAQNKHVLFVFSDGSRTETMGPLHNYEEELLSQGFFKCHRSYIVNIFAIDTYTSAEIKMHSGEKIPISRNFHKDFEDAYFAAIFGKAGDRE